MTDATRLEAQMAFLQEADRLKHVLRATRTDDRFENSAEHSWHIALYAMVLAEHAHMPVDIARVVKMLVLHDLVEIDAGDAPIFGQLDEGAQTAMERAAADRIFGLLPPDQAAAYRALWDEFEAGESDDARFAKSIDRFQPPMQNLATDGGSWRDYSVTYDAFEARLKPKITKGAPALWDWLAPKVSAFFRDHINQS